MGKKYRLMEREKNKLNWDDKLTFEFNGDAPCLASLKIEPVNDVVTVFLSR